MLVLLPFPPDPGAAHGASRMTGQLLAHLAERHEVGAVFLRGPAEPGLDARLRRRLALAEEVGRPEAGPQPVARAARALRRSLGLLAGRPVWSTDWRVPAFARRVEEVSSRWRPDVVQAELHVMGQYLAGTGARRVLVDHDPGAAAAAELARWEGGLRGLGRRADGIAWRRYERRIMSAADAVVAFTERDRAELQARSGAVPLLTIPPGVDIPPRPLDPVGEEPPRVLFLGSFGHPPNVEAALRLARTVFPPVRLRVPGATLEIVGAAPPAGLRRLGGDGIVVTGRVADTRPHLDRAAVVAAPVALGGGMRVKVLEALAAGKALVATPRALGGLAVRPGREALVGESDAELRDALVSLLEDPERRRAMGAAARAWAEAHLDWREVVAAYDALYDRLERAPEARA